MAMMCHVGADGQLRTITPDVLRLETDSWPTTADTPDGPAAMLRLARDTVVTSVIVYEQLTVAVFWSLLAVEVGLRSKLAAAGVPTSAGRRSFGWSKLFQEACANGLVPVGADGAPSNIWDTARTIRNRFAHPEQVSVFSPGMALPMVRTSHVLVAELFPDDPARRG
jgi:hypothetical protein